MVIQNVVWSNSSFTLTGIFLKLLHDSPLVPTQLLPETHIGWNGHNQQTWAITLSHRNTKVRLKRKLATASPKAFAIMTVLD